jgi:hypothetical protein
VAGASRSPSSNIAMQNALSITSSLKLLTPFQLKSLYGCLCNSCFNHAILRCPSKMPHFLATHVRLDDAECDQLMAGTCPSNKTPANLCSLTQMSPK